jgi:putative transposase
MLRFIGLYLGTLVRFLRARRRLLDRLFWVAVRRFWSGWQPSLIVVTPETVVRWHRAGFRRYWKLISKVRRGAPRMHGLLHCSDHILSSLYCFFVISHDRRGILHFNVTKHPTSSWIVQQLREAFSFGSAPRFVIFDRDASYGLEVPVAVRSLRANPVRTSFESPWQNGVAKRWIASCRRDLLDHVIAVHERHLKRLLSEYIRYYHEDRTHLGLGKGTPNGRPRTKNSGRVFSHLRLAGLHHRYDRAA